MLTKLKSLTVVVACLPFLGTGVFAGEIHVYEGESIQAAIDGATGGDEIIVHEGTYAENIDFNGKAITVRSMDPTDPLVVVNTIIDGGGSGSVVSCVSAEGPDTVLSGFAITNGNGTWSLGGGMRNIGSSPTVTNCTFSGNWAGSYGGGMWNESNASPTVTNCTFSGNSVGGGGGGMCNWTGSNPTVTNCTFSGNSAEFGGGMRNFLSSPTVTNCTFSANTAVYGGGGMLNESGNPVVTDCDFCVNAPEAIDGVYTDGGGNSLEFCTPPPPPDEPVATGACCLNDGCIIATEADCLAADGIYMGDDTDCDTAGCPEPCPADITGDEVIDVLDLLEVLGAWGPCL